MEKFEKDLKIYDVWQSPNGNQFIKISNEFSIAIGNWCIRNPSIEWGELEHTQFVKANNIIPAQKIGRIKFEKDYCKIKKFFLYLFRRIIK